MRAADSIARRGKTGMTSRTIGTKRGLIAYQRWKMVK